MSSYDFIYGSKVYIQCQAQINFEPWSRSNKNESRYLILIKKDIDPPFFDYWCKPRHVVYCIVVESPKEHIDDDTLKIVGTKIKDYMKERNRAICWTSGKLVLDDVSGKGKHGKQRIISNSLTFCARDMGINFDPQKYVYSYS